MQDPQQSVSAPHLVYDSTATLREAAWLDALHRDLARDTAECTYLELAAGRLLSVEIASAALDLIIDHAVAVMRDVYDAIGLGDPAAIARGRAIMAEAFVDRFDELVAQAGAARQGGC